MKISVKHLALAAVVTIAGTAQAVTVTIDPDDYTGNMTNVATNARLYAVRPNTAHNDFIFANVYSAAGGSWSPTGSRVFGHSPSLSGFSTQWEGIAVGAKSCLMGSGCTGFNVFGVYFQFSAQSVKVLTTMRGLSAQDPVELWAMDVDGNVLRKCRLMGVTPTVLQTGVLPPPRIYGQPVFNGVAPSCGEVIEVKNCDGSESHPYDCDFVVELRISRNSADIGFAWFGGTMEGNTHTNVDKLTYSFPILVPPLP